MLDGKTTISPYRTATVYEKSVGGAVSQPVKKTLTVKQQVATKIMTAPLKEVTTVSPVRVTVPYVLQSAVKAVESGSKSPVLQFPGKLTETQKTAIIKAMEVKYGQAVVSSPANQRMISLLRTRAIVGNLQNKGMELAPKGTMDYVYNADETNAFLRDAYNALYAQQEQWTAKQTEYQGRLSEMSTELAKGTYQAGVYQQQLASAESMYSELLAKYNQLVNNPPEGSIDPVGAIVDFFRQYGLWILLGIGAVIFIPSLIKATRK